MVSTKKISLVEKIQDLLAKNSNFVLLKIDKTNHQTLEGLRKQLKKTSSLFKVIKNTLLEKTINKLSHADKNFKELKKNFLPLSETNALLLLQKDWYNGLKVSYQFLKKELSLSYKFGLLDSQLYAGKDISNFAQLPSREQLITNIIGTFKSPASHLVYSLQFNLTKLTYILKEKSKKSN